MGRCDQGRGYKRCRRSRAPLKWAAAADEILVVQSYGEGARVAAFGGGQRPAVRAGCLDAPIDFGITQSERTRDGYQKRMIIIALTTVPHTAADAAATRMSAARKPQQMSRPSSSI